MKTVVITGSTRGLGFEMAREFCTNGANVVTNGVNEKRLEDSVAKLRELSGTRESGSKVKAGRLSPGIMFTDFTVQSLGGQGSIDLPSKTKKFYNIVGDYPDVVAEFLVRKMLVNTKNDAYIEWLTSGKIFMRFLTAPFKKEKHFEE